MMVRQSGMVSRWAAREWYLATGTSSGSPRKIKLSVLILMQLCLPCMRHRAWLMVAPYTSQMA